VRQQIVWVAVRSHSGASITEIESNLFEAWVANAETFSADKARSS